MRSLASLVRAVWLSRTKGKLGRDELRLSFPPYRLASTYNKPSSSSNPAFSSPLSELVMSSSSDSSRKRPRNGGSDSHEEEEERTNGHQIDPHHHQQQHQQHQQHHYQQPQLPPQPSGILQPSFFGVEPFDDFTRKVGDWIWSMSKGREFVEVSTRVREREGWESSCPLGLTRVTLEHASLGGRWGERRKEVRREGRREDRSARRSFPRRAADRFLSAQGGSAFSKTHA